MLYDSGSEGMVGAHLGPFELVAPIGQGGMAAVWRAIHPETRTRVAIKVLTGEASHADGPMRALRREARAVARLDHPGVIRILDTGTVPDGVPDLPAGSPWLAMEHASGGTLSSLGTLPWPDLRSVLLGILDALAHAHARGLVHRDLKPGNVLLCSERDSRPGLKLSDFGIATVVDWHVRTGSLAVVAGTLHYMAPEQLTASWRDYGPWTDLYGLGCMGWKLATGRLPFAGRSGPALMRAQLLELPPPFAPVHPMPMGFETWLRRLVEKAPVDRYAYAADAAWALEKLPIVADETTERLVFETDTPRSSTDIVTVSLRAASVSGPGGSLPVGPERPPVPKTWRQRKVPAPPPRLVGAGRGLIGLRQVELVGRENHRDVLWRELYAAMETGQPRLVVLEGPSGVGKSRLAEWLAQRSAELGVTRTAKAVLHAEETAPVALQRMLARALRARQLRGPELLERLEDLFEADPAWLGALAECLGTEDTSAASYGTFLEAMARMAEVRPLLVWLEDVHTRRDALELAARLVGRYRGPLLVVATHTGPAGPWAEIADAVVSMGPMPTRDLAELVRRHLPIERELLQELCGRAAGSPEHALALLTEWSERGRLALTPHGYRLDGPIESTDLAGARDARVEGLLAGLPPSAGIALERVAVAGIPLAPDDWVALGADRAEAETLVDRLLSDGRATFATTLELEGGMFRESLLARAARAGRLEGHHRAVAGWLVSRGVPTARLGHHYEAAGMRAEALDVWLAAAERALSRYEIDKALGLVDRLDARLPEADGRRAEVAVLRVAALWAAGRSRAAYEQSGPLLVDLAVRGPAALHARLSVLHARVLAALGEVARAELVLAEHTDTDAALALAEIRLLDGRPEAACEALRREHDASAKAIRAVCEGLATDAQLEALPDLRLRGVLLAVLANSGSEERRLGRAVALHDAIDPILAAPLRCRLALVLVDRGAFGEAGREAGLALGSESLTPDQHAVAEAVGLVACAAARDWPRFDLALRAVARTLGAGVPAGVARCLEHAGDLARKARLRDRAANAWRLARGVWRQLGDRSGEARVDERIRALGGAR